jgi:hypothetical protein
MVERKGAAYRITSSRPAHHHGEHTQRTQASSWADSISGFTTQDYLMGMQLPGIPEAKKASWDRRYPGAVN